MSQRRNYWLPQPKGMGRAEESVRDLKARTYFGRSEELGAEWCTRYLALKHAGKIAVLLADGGHFYLSSNLTDLWGSKERITVRELKALIESLEKKEAAA